MTWAKQSTRYHFTGLILNLAAFSTKYIKDKNKSDFLDIKNACEKALEIIFSDELPHEADTKMRQTFNNISEAMNRIKQKKGQQERDNFDKDFDLVRIAKEGFDIAFNENHKEKEKEIKAEKKKTASVDHSTSTENSIQVIEDNSQKKHDSDLFIAGKEFLQEKINALDVIPPRDYSWSAFFKETWNRSWKRHPYLSASSAISFYTTISHFVLDTTNTYAGPAVNQWAHADETGIDFRRMLEIAGAVFAVVVGAGVLYISRPKSASSTSSPATEQDQVKVEIISLNDDASHSRESQPLLEKPEKRRSMCC